ncbi:glucosyl-3-phosphoglycerate synthase, partial [Streptomyces sp. SID8455]|nr:glucosyl-3-phosphoglycerate synthase [Streptomyces sp. SID8455]
MLEEVERWLTRRSWSSADRPLDRLTDARDAEP